MAELRRLRSLFIRLGGALVVLVVVLGACGGDDDDGATEASVDDGADDGGDDVSDEAWSDADFERLVEVDVDGFTAQDPNVTEFGNATVGYLEDDPAGPVALSALVTFQACDPFVCYDLDAELDDEQLANVRTLLPRVHIDNPDLVEEIGPTELAGRTVLAAYFRSFVDQDDGQATANSYRAITHDGTNLVVVQVSPDFTSAGGLADSEAELEEQMGVDDGAAVAEAVLAAFDAELD